MKRRTRLLLGCSAAALLGIAAVLLATLLPRETTLEVRVRDAVSRRWIWDLTLKVQDRELRSFYQSDGGLRTFRFTHLRPERSTLEASAPGYPPLRVPVALRRGVNRLAQPLEMTGSGIPGLAGFHMFETREGRDFVVQVRPVDKDGRAILNHPCIGIRVECRLFAELPGGARGTELFRGRIPLAWDAAPEATFRYSARIPGEAVKDDPSPLRVIDYIVVVPASGGEKDHVRRFTDTSWHVKATGE